MWFKPTALVLIVLAGCASTSSYLDVTTHPEFSPLVPMKGKSEYQIVWYRSYDPVVYLKAYRYTDGVGEFVDAYIEYATAENLVPKLKRKKISKDDWVELEQTVEESGFWTDSSPCLEESYKRGSLFWEGDSGCQEIEWNGPEISIAASTMREAKGIHQSCTTDEHCGNLGSIPSKILEIIGKQGW